MKNINYPTQDWIDNWVDKWLEAHPNERVNDFTLIEEKAQAEWWDKEIDKGNPTPYDLTPEQKKAQKETVKGMAKSLKERKPTVRERKPNEEKREIINALFSAIKPMWGGSIANPEKEIVFSVGENSYSVNLICHRKPKQ